jgi:16S rRNA G527 N7-methylase RsmG
VKPEAVEWLVARSAAAEGAGHTAVRALTVDRLAMLSRYEEWLGNEALAAGLLSPTESGRLWTRHIEDSLSFLAGWDAQVPKIVHDAGSGAGLPGIPIAISLPKTRVVLVERSRTRARLLRRAIRVVGLENAEVVAGDIRALGGCEAVVMRGVMAPPVAIPVVHDALRQGGTAVIGLSHRPEPAPEWMKLRGEIVKVSILDPPGWLLIIRNCGD